jgi:hypothetical protein
MNVKVGKVYLVKHTGDGRIMALRMYKVSSIIEYVKLFAIDNEYIDTTQFFKVKTYLFYKMYDVIRELDDAGDDIENYPYLII